MDKIDSADAPLRVGIVPLPGFALMSYACTVEPLRAANLLSKKPLFELFHFGGLQDSQSSGAARIERTHAIGENVDLDILLVVAGGNPFACDAPDVIGWLQKMAKTVPQIGGVSGGTVVLARAGLMSGRRMTVHWEHAAELSESYPELMIERRLYVIDRDRITCGGGTSPIDLMHALISVHHGSAFARLVNDWFLHTDIRAAAAPQRSLRSSDMAAVPRHVADAVAAMEDHIADPLKQSQLAMIVGVSPRHLNRLFQDTFAQSLMDYYRKLRLDTGRRLVVSSAMRIAEIADATGFSTASHFSNQYKNYFKRRPLADRHVERAP